MVSVVVLNTCLCVVFCLMQAKGGGGEKRRQGGGGARRDKGRGGKEGLHFTAKGVTLHGKRSPD